MKNLILLLYVALYLSACNQNTAQKTDEQPKEVKAYSIEQFMDNVSIFGSSFSSDEKQMLVSSNQSGIYNAYTISVDKGEMKPLTDSKKESIFAISYFPNDNRILYRSNEGGNEIDHIFLREEDGKTRDLTPEPKAKAQFYGWAYDRKSFFYASTKRDGKAFDLYEMDIDKFQSKLVYQNDKAFELGAISNDKKQLSFLKAINTNDSEMYLYDVAKKELKLIAGKETKASYEPVDFGVDNQALYYLTDEEGEFKTLKKYDLKTGKSETVLAEKWDIVYAYHSYSGKYRVVGINQDAKTVIKIFDAKSNKPIYSPEFADGEITAVNISKSEKIMTFYVGSSQSPSNLYTYNLESKENRKMTNTLNKEIKGEDLVAGKVVRYPSFDKLDIPAILYKPHQAGKDAQVPALVWVHGGPGGQSTLNYSGLIQYLVNHGYAVLAVNNRGSSGYGKTFYKMDDRNHGDKDLMDCVKGKEYLAGLDFVDKAKIGIIGGSYGGFMVMAAMTSKPEEFAVGINLFGVTNWLRTLKSIPPWWESFKEALYTEMGDPVKDSVRLYNISPLFHADRIARPLMVLQGAQDPRVLKVESDEIVEAAKKNKIPVEYVLFEDEGHGFVKKENNIKANSKILEFLDKYLKKTNSEKPKS
jgi:dipeptidyl aminopeptidase/acylaminoacyl peptidase